MQADPPLNRSAPTNAKPTEYMSRTRPTTHRNANENSYNSCHIRKDRRYCTGRDKAWDTNPVDNASHRLRNVAPRPQHKDQEVYHPDPDNTSPDADTKGRQNRNPYESPASEQNAAPQWAPSNPPRAALSRTPHPKTHRAEDTPKDALPNTTPQQCSPNYSGSNWHRREDRKAIDPQNCSRRDHHHDFEAALQAYPKATDRASQTRQPRTRSAR